INGKKSESKSYQFLLRAKEAGKWTIPSISVENNGRAYTTQPLTIEVVPAGTVSGNQNASLSKDVFLAIVPAKKEAYVGEQIMVYLKIYTRVNITQYSPTKTPNFTGFWAEDFPIKQPLEPEREVLNGVTYSTFTIKRTAVFPTHSGTLSIDPAEIDCELRIAKKGRSNMFDDFFSPFGDPFGQVVQTKLVSNSVEIKVNELPPEKPANFTGLVGNFEVTTSVDKASLKTGEAVVYKVEISGTGNIMSAETPSNPFSDDFEKYDPKSSDEINKKGNLISGKKTFEYVAVPRASRQFEIPPYLLSYFDPAANKYITKSSTPHTLNITAGAGGIASGAGLSKEEIALLSKDIRFIKSDVDDWFQSERSFVYSWWFILLWIFPAGAWLGGNLFLKRRARSLQDVEGMKYRKASPLAKKRLKAAEKLMKDNKVDTFYSEIAKTLSGLVADKLKIPEASLMKEQLEERFREKRVDEALIKEYLDCLHMCDEARFAPESKSKEKIDEAYNRIRSAILNMDKAI
ncbi:BatD family protein, partial [bacterium]|nr:BatD family protein [bacterium]